MTPYPLSPTEQRFTLLGYPVALQVPGPNASASGDPLYAELQHKNSKSSVAVPDVTEVQYSQIKTDEVGRRLQLIFTTYMHTKLFRYPITITLTPLGDKILIITGIEKVRVIIRVG